MLAAESAYRIPESRGIPSSPFLPRDPAAHPTLACCPPVCLPAPAAEDLDLLRAGCCNLAKHISNARLFGVPVVVAINRFATDSDAELELVRQEALAAGKS